jgi:hypothetical protein
MKENVSNVNEQTADEIGLSASSCCASPNPDETGFDWESDPLQELRKTGLWIDEDSYIDYTLIENQFGDLSSIKPNSTSDIQGVIKSLKHLYRARERQKMGELQQIQSKQSEKTSPDSQTSSVDH